MNETLNALAAVAAKHGAELVVTTPEEKRQQKELLVVNALEAKANRVATVTNVAIDMEKALAESGSLD